MKRNRRSASATSSVIVCFAACLLGLLVSATALAQSLPAANHDVQPLAKRISAPPTKQTSSSPTNQASAPPPKQAAQPVAPQSNETQIAVVAARLADQSEQVRAHEARLRELELDTHVAHYQWVWVLAIMGALGITGFGLAWNHVKRRLLDPKIENTVRETLESAITSMRQELLNRTESELLRFARVLALVDSGQHDAALAAYEWSGEVACLRNENAALRRAIIFALYSSIGRNEQERKNNRELAWLGAQELIGERHDAADLRLYLTIATKLGRYQDAVLIVKQKMDQLSGDLESLTRAATILRRAGRIDDAVKLLERVPLSQAPAAIVTHAALNRDLGRFDEAHTVLLPAVKRILDLQPERLEESEARVVNTFVANCMDRNHPEDGLAAADLILGRLAQIRPVEIATIGRLLVTLGQAGHEVTVEMREAYQRRIAELPKSDTRVQAMVQWHRLNNELKQAEKLVTDELLLAERRSDASGANEAERRNAYFFRCLLGEMLLQRGDADKASETLLPATRGGYNGEALFLMAKCELKRGDRHDAIRWLGEAVRILPRWRQVAFNDPLLAKDADVMASLKI